MASRSKILSLSAVIVFAVVAPISADQAVPSAPPARLLASVEYLTGTYRVTTAEAMRRLRLQGDVDALDRRMAAALPNQYAGVWMDQGHGGVLVAAATDPERLRAVVARLPHRDEIQVVPARYSLRELKRVHGQTQRAISTAGSTASAVVDVPANSVTVWADPDALTPAVARLAGGPVRVTTREAGITTQCIPSDCDPPMRGGLAVDMVATRTGPPLAACTSGFNLTNAAGDLFITLAGHCFTKNPTAQFARHNGRAVGKRTGAVFNDVYPLDYAIAPASRKPHWFPPGLPRNTVYFQCVAPSPSPCADVNNNPLFAITGLRSYSNVTLGLVVCMSGASPLTIEQGTRCGEVLAKDGGIKTNICVKQGDSGSPLFDQITRQAIGLAQRAGAGSPTLGICKPVAEQSYTSFFSPLSAALSDANMNGGTYQLITN